jgi:hypothetical protein
MNTLKLIRGDDATFQITFKDQDKVVIDLTGYTIFFTVKKESDLNVVDDTKALIAKTITVIPSPTLGKVAVVISHEETNLPIGVYTWDLQLKSASNIITSTQRGQLEVVQDVSKAII